MSREPDDRAYEALVFECFLKLLSHNGSRQPCAIPAGFENLKDDELGVLAYLQEISGERGAAARKSAEAATEPVLPPEIHAAFLDPTSLEGNENDLSETTGMQLELDRETDDAVVVSLVKAEPLSLSVKEDSGDAIHSEPDAVVDDAGVADLVINEADNDSSQGEVSEPAAGATRLSDLTNHPEAQGESTGEPEPEEVDAMIIGPGGIPKTGLETSRPDPDRINLKNGRARQPYQTSIEGYSGIKLQDNGGADVTISPEGDVSGNQIPAGEYTLLLKALKAGRPVNIRARLSIIADPRDLWKEIASDQQAPRAKSDEASDYCRTAEAFIVAASKRGRSHAQEGKYRDDDFSIRADTETGWHILVVADGAGSADLSREGSRIACEVVIAALPDLLAEKVEPHLEAAVAEYDDDPVTWASKFREELFCPVLPEAALKAAQAIKVEAAEIGRKPQDFSTTIVIAVAKKVAGRWLTGSFTVGDGGVAIFDAEKNQVAVICRPDSGEFAGQTRFLACSEFADAEDIMGRIFIDLRENFTVLAAMTDGITDPKFPTDSAFENAQTWSEFWADDLGKEVDLQRANTTIESQMLNWLDFWSRGNHDDRTIALMLPEPQGVDEKNECITELQIADNSADVRDSEENVKETSTGQDDSVK